MNDNEKKYCKSPRMNYEFVLPWQSMLLAEIEFDNRKRMPEVSCVVSWDAEYPVEDYMDLMDRYLEFAAEAIDGYFSFDDDMTKEEEDTLAFYYNTFIKNLRSLATAWMEAVRDEDDFPDKEEDITSYLAKDLSVTNSFYANLSFIPHRDSIFNIRFYMPNDLTADEITYCLARFAAEIFPPDVLAERLNVEI